MNYNELHELQNSLIKYYNDDGTGKLDFVNALRSLGRKESNDKSLGVLIRHFLSETEL
mgnify:CR=1 FL=1